MRMTCNRVHAANLRSANPRSVQPVRGFLPVRLSALHLAVWHACGWQRLTIISRHHRSHIHQHTHFRTRTGCRQLLNLTNNESHRTTHSAGALMSVELGMHKRARACP
eukprot:jgi/Ulvmu1/11717/UM008_0128.1